MVNNNDNNIPIISIKTIEKNLAKTYTDKENNIKTLEKIAKLTHRSFNDVLKEIVNNFIQNGKIYDPEKDKFYTVREFVNMDINSGNKKMEKNIDTLGEWYNAIFFTRKYAINLSGTTCT